MEKKKIEIEIKNDWENTYFKIKNCYVRIEDICGYYSSVEEFDKIEEPITLCNYLDYRTEDNYSSYDIIRYFKIVNNFLCLITEEIDDRSNSSCSLSFAIDLAKEELILEEENEEMDKIFYSIEEKIEN